MLEKCPVCKEFKFSGSHRCPPSWLVWDDENQMEEPLKVYAVTEEKAIEKILSPILHDEFDDKLRIFFVLPSNSNYFGDKEELEEIQETLKDEDFFESYDDEDRQDYEEKAIKLAASIESETAKIKKFEVQPYMTWGLNFKLV
jgi:hypothetical protein